MNDADVRRQLTPLIAAGIAALLAVAVATTWIIGRHTATPKLIEGWAMPTATGSAISLHDSTDREGNPGEGYIIAGANWLDADGTWHQGSDLPTCIGTDPSTFTRVQLGVVTVKTRDGASWPHVVWLKCLE